MATYNGEKYLKWQLKSFLDQTHKHWKIAVSDDGSTDCTLSILNDFQKELGNERVSLFSGPKQGHSKNFLSLICNNDVTADYYAYSDQDDIWETDKLERAIESIKKVPSDIPALYCGRTTLFDDSGKILGYSKLFTKTPCFQNALVQSISGGNTMVFNQAARELLQKVRTDVAIRSHDWLSYLIISGCGGFVFYDSYPSLRYRQHNDNLIGMNNTWAAKLFRIRQLLQGRFKNWNEQNRLILSPLYPLLTPENQRIFDQFVKAKQAWLLPRLFGFLKSGVYHQTLFGNFGLMIAALFKKI